MNYNIVLIFLLVILFICFLCIIKKHKIIGGFLTDFVHTYIKKVKTNKCVRDIESDLANCLVYNNCNCFDKDDILLANKNYEEINSNYDNLQKYIDSELIASKGSGAFITSDDTYIYKTYVIENENNDTLFKSLAELYVYKLLQNNNNKDHFVKLINYFKTDNSANIIDKKSDKNIVLVLEKLESTIGNNLLNKQKIKDYLEAIYIIAKDYKLLLTDITNTGNIGIKDDKIKLFDFGGFKKLDDDDEMIFFNTAIDNFIVVDNDKEWFDKVKVRIAGSMDHITYFKDIIKD